MGIEESERAGPHVTLFWAFQMAHRTKIVWVKFEEVKEKGEKQRIFVKVV